MGGKRLGTKAGVGVGATSVIDQFWERSFHGWSLVRAGAGWIGGRRQEAGGRRQADARAGTGVGGHKGQGQRLATAASAGAGARGEGREFDGLAAPRPPPPHLLAEDCHLSQRDTTHKRCAMSDLPNRLASKHAAG